MVYKCPFFRLLFFRQYKAGKCLLRYAGSKKRHCNLLKPKSLKSRKTDIFPRGLTHGFGLKMADFPTFFLGNIGQENVFYDIVERKNAFLGYKNKKFKKSKNWHFSKGVNPYFWSKIGRFSIFFFFMEYRPGNCLLRYSRTK